MKNKEKYAKEILEIACSHGVIAFNKTTNKVVPCNSLCCSNCLFGHNCDEAIKEWCESEYVEPPVDWSKVSVDTPILVRDSEFDGWSQRHFAKCDNGTVRQVRRTTTSTLDLRLFSLMQQQMIITGMI